MVTNYFISLGLSPVDTRGDSSWQPYECILTQKDTIHPEYSVRILLTKKHPRVSWLLSKVIDIHGSSLENPLMHSHWSLTDRMMGRIYLDVERWLMEELGRDKQTFSALIQPHIISQSIKPMLYLIFKVILKKSPTTLSYTSNQLLVMNFMLITPPP